jgi:hypothetical protein
MKFPCDNIGRRATFKYFAIKIAGEHSANWHGWVADSPEQAQQMCKDWYKALDGREILIESCKIEDWVILPQMTPELASRVEALFRVKE